MAPKPPERKIAGLPRNVWALGLTSFFTDISSEMTLNLVPLYLFNVLLVKTSTIGLIEGIAEATASLLKVFSGYLSDRIAKRKGLTVGGYALSAISKPFLYFADTWGWVLSIRFADRTGKGVRTSPRDALIADSINEDQRGLAFGVHRAADTAGAFIGLIIAAVVVWHTQAGSTLLSRRTFQTVVLLSIIPGVLSLLSVAFGVRERSPAQTGKPSPRLSLGVFQPRFKYFVSIVILFTLGNSSDAFLTLRAQERGLNVLQVMGMLITFNLVYALLSGPAGALSDRIGRRRLLIAGWLLYGLIYLGFGLAQAGWQIWALYAMYGVYYGAVEGTAKAYVADLVSPHQRGTAYGVFNAAVGLTAFPASLIAGLLWQGVGPWAGFGASAPFFFGAGLALLAVVLFLVWL
jgi:MFS family permease